MQVPWAVELFDPVANVGLQPRLVGRATATLVNKFPLINTEPRPLGHQAARFGELNLVAAVLRHRRRYAVGREEDPCGRPLFGSDLR